MSFLLINKYRPSCFSVHRVEQKLIGDSTYVNGKVLLPENCLPEKCKRQWTLQRGDQKEEEKEEPLNFIFFFVVLFESGSEEKGQKEEEESEGQKAAEKGQKGQKEGGALFGGISDDTQCCLHFAGRVLWRWVNLSIIISKILRYITRDDRNSHVWQCLGFGFLYSFWFLRLVGLWINFLPALFRHLNSI